MKYSFLLIFSILFISCETEEEKELLFENFATLDNQKKGVIMPLEVGNMWVYRHETFNSTLPISFDTIKIEGEVYNEKGKAFSIERITSGILNKECYINKTNGLWGYKDSSILFIKYPASIGEEWSKIHYCNDKIIQENYKVIDNNSYIYKDQILYTGVYVYEKTIEILKPENLFPVPGSKILAYFQANLGLLKVEYYSKDKLSSVTELISYQLN